MNKHDHGLHKTVGQVDRLVRRSSGEIFLKFPERIGEETLAALDPHEFLIPGLIASGKRLPTELQPHVLRMVELRILDRTGRGKAILPKRHYESTAGVSMNTAERDIARQLNLLILRNLAQKPVEPLLAHRGCNSFEFQFIASSNRILKFDECPGRSFSR